MARPFHLNDERACETKHITLRPQPHSAPRAPATKSPAVAHVLVPGFVADTRWPLLGTRGRNGCRTCGPTQPLCHIGRRTFLASPSSLNIRNHTPFCSSENIVQPHAMSSQVKKATRQHGRPFVQGRIVLTE